MNINKLPILSLIALLVTVFSLSACSDSSTNNESIETIKEQSSVKSKVVETASLVDATETSSELTKYASQRLSIYTPFELTADLSHLSNNQKQMIGILIDASKIMNDLFWVQSYGDKDQLLSSVQNADVKQFIHINYGPWDRLAANKSFVDGIDDKPLGANIYPKDMTKEELSASTLADKNGLYSMVRRDKEGNLITIPYSEFFVEELTQVSNLLLKASELADDKDFANYLKLRSAALLSNEYQASDMAWMDMKSNPIELVIGPIETYEDQMFGYRAAFEGYVLIKDLKWSERLAKFASFLPELQKGLPVADKYKAEMPGANADLNAYDVIYYAGDSNAGSKTIAINLPNDEEVQLLKGTRRLQLKNAMQAKFDKILVPISEQLIAQEQRRYITFDAFFANTMFHEVAHGLGIKNTLDGKGTVRQALLETASSLEEGKADILGLYMITKLYEKGEIKQGELMDNYVTFMTSVFRSIRFGASSAHGRANMVRFNFFSEMGAFSRDLETGLYSINYENMQKAMNALSEKLLVLQGDGDYQGAKDLIKEKGIIGKDLQDDLDKLTEANIPVDVTFIQGKSSLKLD
ncbi:MAG: hypothetical protein ACI9N9_002700 [Enterobacterales bacterium]|jgi:hypothetical protein